MLSRSTIFMRKWGQSHSRNLHHSRVLYKSSGSPEPPEKQDAIVACARAGASIQEVSLSLRTTIPTIVNLGDIIKEAADGVEKIGNAVTALGPDLQELNNKFIPDINQLKREIEEIKYRV